MSLRLRFTLLACAAMLVSACSSLPVPDSGERATDSSGAVPAPAAVAPAQQQQAGSDEGQAPLPGAVPAEAIPLKQSPAVPATDAAAASTAADAAHQETRSEEIAEGEAVPDAATTAAAPEPGALTMMEDIPPNTFIVTAAVKDESHPFYGIGDPRGLVVNGVQGKELIVVRGETYTFKVDTGVQHDFYLSTSSRGWGAATWTHGVKGNFTYDGVVTFTPDKDTPDLLYYQCRNHKNMGSMIHVVDKGGEDKVKLGVKPEAAPKGSAAARPPVTSAFTGNGSAAAQKVRFAEMFINMSPATRRIEASDNRRARDTLEEARSELAAAQKELGKDDEAALVRVDRALRLMTEAGKLVPNPAQLAEQKSRYEEQLHGVETFKESYQRNYDLMVKKKGEKNVPSLDMDEVDRRIGDARRLASDDQYVEANRVLHEVQRELTGTLSKMLDDEVMSYELNFATPAEEYEYELSRYKSYEELIPLAIEQKRPPKQTVALMDRFVAKGQEIHALALDEAKAGNYPKAIQMLQGATSHMQRALRIAGVR